jgi:hypothetical protein
MYVCSYSIHPQELYNSIEKMRPTLFRMASELKQDEEGMAEILQTNETVIRVMDRYKAIFGEPPSTTASSTTTNGTPSTTSTATTGGSTTTVTSSSGAAGGGEGATASAGATAASKQDDVLIDLLDLDLGPPPSGGGSGGGGGGAAGGGNLASGSGTNLGSLLDDFESLSKEMMFSLHTVLVFALSLSLTLIICYACI